MRDTVLITLLHVYHCHRPALNGSIGPLEKPYGRDNIMIPMTATRLKESILHLLDICFINDTNLVQFLQAEIIELSSTG